MKPRTACLLAPHCATWTPGCTPLSSSPSEHPLPLCLCACERTPALSLCRRPEPSPPSMGPHCSAWCVAIKGGPSHCISSAATPLVRLQ
jgi:hypothetical protein